MKKLFLIFLAAVMLSSCERKNAPQSAQGGTAEQIPADETVAQKPVYKFVNTLDGLNVRDRAGGNRVAFLECNERVEILETDESAEIDGWHGNWCKIRTENGTEGYVFDAYLSDNLENAASFRCTEILMEEEAWFKSWEEKLSGHITIDTNPYHIWRDDYGEELRDFREYSGVDLHLLHTYDKEKGTYGWFLLRALCYADGEDYPDFLPFKIGDNIEKVREIFGKENLPESDSTVYVWENGNVFMKVEISDGGMVSTVTLEKTGW